MACQAASGRAGPFGASFECLHIRIMALIRTGRPSGGTDGTVRLIDIASDSVAGSMPGESNQDVEATFSRDGREVLASYADGKAFDWPIVATDWAATACAVAGRTLTQAEWDQYLPGRPYQPACAH